MIDGHRGGWQNTLCHCDQRIEHKMSTTVSIKTTKCSVLHDRTISNLGPHLWLLLLTQMPQALAAAPQVARAGPDSAEPRLGGTKQVARGKPLLDFGVQRYAPPVQGERYWLLGSLLPLGVKFGTLWACMIVTRVNLGCKSASGRFLSVVF
jgi:hypothetical protein